MSTSRGPGLYEFLIEAELQQYYAGIKNDLKVSNVPQLKYVTDDDLHHIGMSKPEMRRLRKFFQKHFPQNYLLKFKKMILPKREEHVASMMAMLPDEGPEKPPIKVPNKHIIPAEAIIVNKELGTGEFGVVQQGVWTNDGERIQVAIKCLSRERMQNNPIEFLKEAAIMHGIDHEHIVRLYGVVLDTSALMLVTELAPLRSLLECLKEPSLRSSFSVPTLCDFAIQICDGMQYLEIKRLIHRDLAARNILVFSKNKVKISDFGLSRALGVGKDYYQTNFNVNLKLPIAWCAPESITFLKFTSASDVWAYGVTLWEMFSYGFQPWAALTGHQILEAIDEPNFQRLEQPECAPKEYYSIMLKCWQHDPNKRPRFADLLNLLPECKPEQVQAVPESVEDGSKPKRDQLVYCVGDIITVLDKGPLPNVSNCWKGVLNNGKSGLFNPAHTVAYLGSNLPSNKPGEIVRGDGKNAYSSRRRLRPDMISSPQGDLKHTGHVGLDGAYFGDISFLGGKQYHHLPHQIVTPYKPQDDNGHPDSDHSLLIRTSSVASDRAPLISGEQNKSESSNMETSKGSKFLLDHEYHEISDEETTVDSPRFENSFDFGTSLLDEMDAMFRSLGSSVPPSSPGPPPSPASPLDETINVHNEIREMAAKVTGKKKQAMVKPISAADEKTLDCAIAMANELAARSMNDLDSSTPPESPRTPNKRKFSFRFPSTSGNKHTSPKAERRTFSEEAASISDIQSSITTEAKEVYNSLVEQPLSAPPPSSLGSPTTVETNPLRMLRNGAFPVVRPRVRGNKHNPNGMPQTDSVLSGGTRSLPRLRVPPPPTAPPPVPVQRLVTKSEGNSEAFSSCGPHNYGPREGPLSSQGSDDNGDVFENITDAEDTGNPIPLPPRDRSRPQPPSKPRHQRKHPLIIPGEGLSRTLVKVASENADLPTYLEVQSEISELNQEPASNQLDHTSNQVSEDDSFEQRIACELAALDDITDDHSMVRHDDHVSCEDLLEFACDAPNTRRTQGKAHGIESDEVRIMGKVLGADVSAECCVAALNTVEWDVHQAIKLARLYNLLQTTMETYSDWTTCKEALEKCNWDVSRGAGWVLAQGQNRDTTQVYGTALASLHPSPTDTCSLYLNLATLAALPLKCSRHNTPSRSHAISKIVRSTTVGVDESIVIVCERSDVFASACAVARAYPLYSCKTSNSSSTNQPTVSVEFLVVPGSDIPSERNGLPDDMTPISKDDLECITATCHGIRLAAKIVDAPCNQMNVDHFLQEVQATSLALGTSCLIIRGEELNAKGFGGIYGVGKAASVGPALAVLSHKPDGATQSIAWVGKGIVYDTGGLSIKGKTAMPGMKRDCGGAAAILGAFYCTVKAGFNQNLHAVFCLAENAVGPSATRPDDIHTLYSGRTVEINNTDAEGRLVLSDGVAYAQKDLKANIILDMATLTGAQGISTGKYHGAVLTNNEDWEEACVHAGKVSGDLVFPILYCPELHFSEFASAVADMKNSVADRNNAQSSCAGLFIGAHLGFDYPGVWMHVDMAYPVHCGERATGYGVALLATLFGNFSNDRLLQALAPPCRGNGTDGGNACKKLKRN